MFSYFSMLLMSTHNILFDGEIGKISKFWLKMSLPGAMQMV